MAELRLVDEIEMFLTAQLADRKLHKLLILGKQDSKLLQIFVRFYFVIDQ